MKLVVGLGNPGRKYEGTRHNVGFVVAAELARRHGGAAARTSFEGELTEIRVGSERVLLLRPQTFMNLSGRSARAARDFYKLANDELLVVCDDFNLSLGKLRVRSGGSAGGHNGLEDVIRGLGEPEFGRLRIGVGQPPATLDPADYVLSRFTRQEQPEIDLAVARAADAVEVWVGQGIGACMNQFNGSVA